MEVTVVYVQVKPQHISEFIEASHINHKASIQEPGNLRFDILQMAEDPSHFILYEAYQSMADAVAHKNTPHYERWRKTVADWMASPREGVAYTGLYPS
jgi:autoinducer 2-degrading protein